MKRAAYLLLILGAIVMSSCDRVPISYRNIPDIDSTFYPGVWGEYVLNEWPTFEQNTNTHRNVLIDKFTGHNCGPCPKGSDTIINIANDFSPRVFYASIHAGPGGMTLFQNFNSLSNQFYTNHTNSVGLAYGAYFLNVYGFDGMPNVTINRELFGGSISNMFGPAVSARPRVVQTIQENDLNYNIQSKFRYFNQTQGGYLHVEIEKLQNENPEVDLIVYVIQDSLRDWQKKDGVGNISDYKHTNKHLGNIDNQVWGQRLNFSNSSKVYKDYSFGKPSGIELENIHFLIFVCDSNTKEVYQVIKQKMVG